MKKPLNLERIARRNKAKLSFEMLEREMETLNRTQKTKIIAGSGSIDTIYISGGYLVEENGGVRYCGNNGTSVFFEDVSLSSSYVADGTEYQLNGTIHISESWASDGFDINDFAHEYGHYLQQQQMGNWAYYTEVAVPSMMSAGSTGHNEQPYEQEATDLGSEYLQNHWD